MAMEVAAYFGLDRKAAATSARSVARAIAKWRSVARAHGLGAPQIDRMATAFEHGDVERALKLRS